MTATGASRLQRSLVVLQAALWSLVLLVVRDLFSQSLNKLQSTDLRSWMRRTDISCTSTRRRAGYSQTQLEGALPHDRAAVPRAAGYPACRYLHLHSYGRQHCSEYRRAVCWASPPWRKGRPG